MKTTRRIAWALTAAVVATTPDVAWSGRISNGPSVKQGTVPWVVSIDGGVNVTSTPTGVQNVQRWVSVDGGSVTTVPSGVQQTQDFDAGSSLAQILAAMNNIITVNTKTVTATGPKLGVLYSVAGASVDAGQNVFPGSAFSLSPFTWYTVECNAAACVGTRPYADCNLAGPYYEPNYPANTLIKEFTDGGGNISVMAVAGDAGCGVWPIVQ